MAGQVDLHPDVFAQIEGQRVRVEVGEPLLLPAVDGQRLAEVAVAVEQADRHEGHTEVGSGLEVVPGEDPQAARVLRDGLGDPELGREVADPVAIEQRSAFGVGGDVPRSQLVVEPARQAHVGVERGRCRGDPFQEGGVGGQLLQPRCGHLRQHAPGVVATRFPDSLVDGAEDVPCRAVP